MESSCSRVIPRDSTQRQRTFYPRLVFSCCEGEVLTKRNEHENQEEEVVTRA
jgi:hypothetical protein